MIYYIKYGNRLYLAREDIQDSSWTHDIGDADLFTLREAQCRILELKQDTGLYEARIVPESDIALTVESVP